MAQTRLQLVNKALLSIGEREVPSTATSSVSRLAANIIEEALVELQHEGIWSFRRTRAVLADAVVTAVGNDYTISDLYDLTDIKYDTWTSLPYYQPDRYGTLTYGYTVLEDKNIRLFDGHDSSILEFV